MKQPPTSNGPTGSGGYASEVGRLSCGSSPGAGEATLFMFLSAFGLRVFSRVEIPGESKSGCLTNWKWCVFELSGCFQ
jgi:hypothetical protein